VKHTLVVSGKKKGDEISGINTLRNNVWVKYRGWKKKEFIYNFAQTRLLHQNAHPTTAPRKRNLSSLKSSPFF